MASFIGLVRLIGYKMLKRIGLKLILAISVDTSFFRPMWRRIVSSKRHYSEVLRLGKLKRIGHKSELSAKLDAYTFWVLLNASYRSVASADVKLDISSIQWCSRTNRIWKAVNSNSVSGRGAFIAHQTQVHLGLAHLNSSQYSSIVWFAFWFNFGTTRVGMDIYLPFESASMTTRIL